ncbi:FeoA family protein [Austwickia chelonae]|uniref:FeoA family protein n=1 Tax=Austwickia chelonae TaxID=100225 RepID=UPI0013C2DDFC|nr:FeoA family protein [Austwickia chelonae]
MPCSKTLLSLAEMPLGVSHTLESVAAIDGARRRLSELGLRPGARLTVLRRTAGGGRIISVAGSRIALDAQTTRQLTGYAREATA